MQQKTWYEEFYVHDSFIAALGELEVQHEDFKLNSRLPGWEACLTWVQLLTL